MGARAGAIHLHVHKEAIVNQLHASPQVIPATAPLGACVSGIDLGKPLDADAFGFIESALHAHQVIVCPNQQLDDAQQKAFSLRFGDSLDIHAFLQFAKPEHPEVYVLSNKIINGKPVGAADAAQYWHTDLSYTSHPSRVSILYAIEVPFDDTGPLGDTEFASTTLAYEALSPELKKRLEGKRAVHLAQKPKKSASSHFTKPLAQETQSRLTEVSHPVVRTHPYTGKKCLYVNEGFTLYIEGMARDESDSLLEELFAHMTHSRFVYVHKWSVGDVLIWDNCSTIHQGVPNYGRHQPRLMYRTIVKGTVPF